MELGLTQDVLAQYRAVRENVGLIDRSDSGKLAITGADRLTWLQGMVSNDVRLLEKPGFAGRLEACILDATGHVMTDLALIKVGVGAVELASALGLDAQEFLLLDLPLANVTRIMTLLNRFLITEDVEILDVTDRLGCLSLQGPNAAHWDQSQFFADICHDYQERDAINVVEADHTGSTGFDIYIPSLVTGEIFTLVRNAPNGGITRVCVEAEEILRVEAGIPRYGRDMDESTIALEANLRPSHISLTKGCYVGQEIIARIDSRGHTNRALTGLVFPFGQAPAPGDKIRSLPGEAESEGRETGRITSVVRAAPAADGRPIALGYVRHEHRAAGATLSVGENGLQAQVQPLPFYMLPDR